MIAQGLMLLCAVAFSQGFLFNPAPRQLVPIVIPQQPIIHKVPVVRTIRHPVLIERTIRVPQYIERAVPAQYPVGGGVSSGAIAGASAGSSLGSFGLNAQIEDADTVNIVAGVSGLGGAGQSFDNNNNFNNNDDGFGRSFGGQSFGGFRGGQQIQPRVSVSQTQISQPSTRVSQPQIVGKGGHGLPPKGFRHF